MLGIFVYLMSVVILKILLIAQFNNSQPPVLISSYCICHQVDQYGWEDPWIMKKGSRLECLPHCNKFCCGWNLPLWFRLLLMLSCQPLNQQLNFDCTHRPLSNVQQFRIHQFMVRFISILMIIVTSLKFVSYSNSLYILAESFLVVIINLQSSAVSLGLFSLFERMRLSIDKTSSKITWLQLIWAKPLNLCFKIYNTHPHHFMSYTTVNLMM